MVLDQARFEAVAALGLGFAFAGLLVTATELLARRPVGLARLQTGGFAALANVPLLVFSAPFLIIRAALKESAAGPPRPFYVLLTTVLAGSWSLLSGRLVFDLTLRLAGA